MKYLLIIWFAVLSFGLHAQKETALNPTLDTTGVLYSDSSIRVNFETVICSPKIGFDQEVLLLSFSNLTAENLKISWHLQLYYNGVCKTCDYPDEYTFDLLLAPNEVLSGDCSILDQKLVVFSKFMDSGYKGNVQLTTLNIGNLTIHK